MLIKKTILCGLIISSIFTSAIASASETISTERLMGGMGGGMGGIIGGILNPMPMPDIPVIDVNVLASFWGHQFTRVITKIDENSEGADNEVLEARISYRNVNENTNKFEDHVFHQNFYKYNYNPIDVPSLSTYLNIKVTDYNNYPSKTLYDKNFCFYNNLLVTPKGDQDPHTLVEVTFKKTNGEYTATVSSSEEGYILETLANDGTCWTEKPLLPNPNHG